jgi:LysM repeat protein
MNKNFTYLSLIAAFAMTACSTTQEPSQYRQMNSAQNSSVSMGAYQECLKSETNRELLGGALGGTAGAIAGEKLLGDTKGVVAGAALGGIVGYGIGGTTMNCDTPPTNHSNTTYQSAPQSSQTYGVTPAAFRSVSCPAGTISQPNGTCLIREAFASTQAHSESAVQTSAYQQFETTPRTTNLVKANALMATSTQSMPQMTRQNNAATYQVASGDTVYSLARRLCVSVDEIQGSNGLNKDYGIQIGQTLQLPSNHC